MLNEFSDLMFYEIYPTSFYDSNDDGIGDLNGITAKLDYVKDLGFNAIWLNPFYKSPFKDGGYDVEDFFEVDPRFGIMDDFKNLLKVAHEKGIKIIIDLVAGHASEDNPIFRKSAEPVRNEYSDLFIWNDNVWSLEPGYRLIAGRYDRHGCFMVNFFEHQPAFNFGFKEVKYPSWQMSYKDERTFLAREYLLKIMRFYLDMGADGFRVDMADSLVKDDEDKSATIEVWNYLFGVIKKEYPHSFFVSEWSYPERAFKAGFDCDFVLDHWDNFFHRLARSAEYSRGTAALNGGDIDFMINDLLYRVDASKKANKPLGIISGNHDTIRIANYLDEQRLRLFYLIMFTLPGIPFMYYGDEIGMKYDPLHSKDGGYQRTGTRTPMQWDHSKNMGFSNTDKELYLPLSKASTVTVEDQLNGDSMLNLIKKLTQIRKEYKELQDIDLFKLDVKDRVIRIDRGNLELVVNLSSNDVTLDNEIIISTSQGNIVKPYTGALIRK